jgi:hypothetical protein
VLAHCRDLINIKKKGAARRRRPVVSVDEPREIRTQLGRGQRQRAMGVRHLGFEGVDMFEKAWELQRPSGVLTETVGDSIFTLHFSYLSVVAGVP